MLEAVPLRLAKLGELHFGHVGGFDVERMMREFEEEGVTLSNPCDETKANMEVELEKWEE